MSHHNAADGLVEFLRANFSVDGLQVEGTSVSHGLVEIRACLPGASGIDLTTLCGHLYEQGATVFYCNDVAHGPCVTIKASADNSVGDNVDTCDASSDSDSDTPVENTKAQRGNYFQGEAPAAVSFKSTWKAVWGFFSVILGVFQVVAMGVAMFLIYFEYVSLLREEENKTVLPHA